MILTEDVDRLRRVKHVLFACAGPDLYQWFEQMLPKALRDEPVMSLCPPDVSVGSAIPKMGKPGRKPR
jgi:hypothetical protein